MKNRMFIIPDTNFLIYITKYKLLDKLGEYSIVLIKQIIDELKKLSEDKKTKIEDRDAALIVLEFLKRKKFKIKKCEGKTDDAILCIAKKYNTAIATMDKELIKRAKKSYIKVIKIRQKKYLREE